MFQPLPLYLGLRYTRARRRNHFVSFISLTSMLGIALGVSVLITVLSVMNGFQTELRSRILGLVSHATLQTFDGPLENWKGLLSKLEQDPRVTGVAPYVDAEVMITRGGEVTGALIRGVDPDLEPRVSRIHQHMVAGSLDDLEPGSWNIVLGRTLAMLLGVDVGDRVTVVSPEARMSVAGVLPRIRRFTVVGLFSLDMSQYDRSLAVMHLQDAATLFRLGEGVTGLRLQFDDLMAAPRLARGIAEDLPGFLRVSDWTMQHRNFFRAVQTEKTVMFVILLLIVAVAAFNIVSTLVMVVTDKQADIAILRTLGAAPHTILGVFVVQGTVIGIVGTLLGVVGGVSLALNVETLVPFIENLFGVRFLSPDIYLISELPSELHVEDVWRITLASLVLSLLATLYPAWRAARTQPAEALRYE